MQLTAFHSDSKLTTFLSAQAENTLGRQLWRSSEARKLNEQGRDFPEVAKCMPGVFGTFCSGCEEEKHFESVLDPYHEGNTRANSFVPDDLPQ